MDLRQPDSVAGSGVRCHQNRESPRFVLDHLGTRPAAGPFERPVPHRREPRPGSHGISRLRRPVTSNTPRRLPTSDAMWRAKVYSAVACWREKGARKPYLDSFCKSLLDSFRKPRRVMSYLDSFRKPLRVMPGSHGDRTADVSSASVWSVHGSGPVWNSRVGYQSTLNGLDGQAFYRCVPTPVRPVCHCSSVLAAVLQV